VQSSAAQLQQAITGLHTRIDPIAEDVTTIGSEITGLVESAADGAVLDSRITQSVNDAVRRTEQRLMEHVDEAVLALAQTLLKPRGAGSASLIPEPADTETTGAPAAPATAGGFSTEPIVPEATSPEPTATPASSGRGPWWRRDVDRDASDLGSAVESNRSADAGDEDMVPDEWWQESDSADEAAVVAAEPTRAAALEDEAADLDELDELEDLEAIDDGAVDDDADDEAGLDPADQLSSGYAISASGHATEAWTKDDPVTSESPVSEEEPGKRKRRWGRRSR
jgi:hypothetical protein